MQLSNNIQALIPVLPSSDISRDVDWYNQMLGFQAIYIEDGYAVLGRDAFRIHLQWHANTVTDPIVGSFLKIVVQDIQLSFDHFSGPLQLKPEQLQRHTPWNTHEFGCYDLNKNAIVFVQFL